MAPKEVPGDTLAIMNGLKKCENGCFVKIVYEIEVLRLMALETEVQHGQRPCKLPHRALLCGSEGSSVSITHSNLHSLRFQ